MTDYSAMSDDHINAEVTLIIGSHSADGHYPDYCNDWAAIGPIIEKYEIDLDFDRDKNEWLASGIGEYTQAAFAPNPRRAAAICFLMMQEA